jgi:hypothetical protein
VGSRSETFVTRLAYPGKAVLNNALNFDALHHLVKRLRRQGFRELARQARGKKEDRVKVGPSLAVSLQPLRKPD